MTSPIEVDIDNRLTINGNQMQKYQLYRFRFLDTDMVAIKEDFGIELYQEMDYLDIKDAMERGLK